MIEFVPPGTHIDFISRWRVAAVISIAVIAAGMAAVPFRLSMGIDFAGGSEIQVRFADSVQTDESQIRDALEGVADGVSVVRFGNDQEYLVRYAVQEGEEGLAAPTPNAPDAAAAAPAPSEGERPAAEAGDNPAAETEEGGAEEAPDAGAVEAAAAGDASDENPAEEPEAAGGLVDGNSAMGERADRLRARLEEQIGPVSLERVEFVGPRVGAELRRAGLLSLGLAGLMILAYISFRFTFRFAPGAIVALLHDVLLTSGIWVLMGREFNLQVLAALLAIVGYSLNDTIIVYDRIRENMELRTTTDLPEVLNRSINQTLSRTVLTSVTTLLAVLSLLLLGGEVIRPFATAMAIGIAIGTYSSVFVAAPVLLWLEARHSEAAA